VKQYILVIIALNFIFCNIQNSDNNFLVRINDRIITKNDFIERSEYTIRPSYCKSDNNIHKKIILNSLIAEKLMAIEIENNLSENNYSSNFIEGIKEQTMRESLLKEEVFNNIVLDSLTILSHYSNSTKIYNIDFLSFNNDSISIIVDNLLKNGISFDDVCYDYLKLTDIPNRLIDYFEEYDPNVHAALFSRGLKKNEVVGPIYSKDNKVLFVKILGWSNKPPITNENKTTQFKAVEQKLYENLYNREYDLYISSIMKGTELIFYEKPFFYLAEKTYNDLFLDKNKKLDLSNNLDSIINLESPLLSLNEDVYTIKEINDLIKKHPLVFRNKDINKSDYPLQFKYAIVDLIRDEKLNNLAYYKKYDAHPEVIKQITMFEDASISNLHLQAFLRGKNITPDEFNKNYLKILETDINKYIDSLQEKYSSIIQINFDLLDKINLTHIDLYAYKIGVPYPYVVPSFPILTSKHEIDYGIKVNF
jgi:hypothetical protein